MRDERLKKKTETPPHGDGQRAGSRGVTRPNMEAGHDHAGKRDAQTAGEKNAHMSSEERHEMTQKHHIQTLWIYWTIIILGIWMVMSPLTFDYGKHPVAPAGGREVWLALADRIAFLKWSDILSGFVLIFFGWRSLRPDRPLSIWICCFTGIWLSMAPLVFWAPTAVAYLNDTLVGAFIVALTILVPGMPNMMMYMKMGSEVPPGWSYNPSSWPQRWIMIATGFLGWMVSRYLAAFQLGFIDVLWDPFFGDQSVQVLNSAMSHSLPVSDAGLGSLAYTFEFLMGYMGSPSRWRTMPWMVAFFGILVIPLGLVHIFLVISQPLIVGAWCTFCLMAAAIMLPMIPLEADEVIAMGQHIAQARKNGERFWHVFWKGGKPVEMNRDQRSPELVDLATNTKAVLKSSLWGMSAPWTLTSSALLGIVIMAAPAMFGLDIKESAADLGHLAGALIVVISVISMGEIFRAARFLNLLSGAAIAILPWLVAHGDPFFKITNAILGVLVVALSLPRGTKKETYGLWDRFVR